MKWIILTFGVFSLFACQLESEEVCYSRLQKDFTSYADTAKELGDYDGAIAALDSGMAALTIKLDSDRNICDYVSAGPYLQRK